MQLRESILKDVNRTIEQREKTHGDATQTFHNLGKTWNMEAYQAALFCVDLKRERLSQNPDNVDNWRDMIGYLAIAYQLYTIAQRHGRGDKDETNI